MISRMALELNSGQIRVNMKESIRWANEKEKASTFGPMVVYMTANGWRTKYMVRERTFGQTVENIKVSGILLYNFSRGVERKLHVWQGFAHLA